MRKYICLLLCPLFFFLVYNFAAIAKAAAPKHILFLHSHTEEFPAHKLFENGFKKHVQITNKANVEYSYEYLELTKFSANARYPEQLAVFLKQKFAIKPPDLVVTHLGPAADFVLKHGRDTFPDAQFIMAVDEVEGVSDKQLPMGFGGLAGAFDAKETVKTILQLQPRVRQIYVVLGSSEREKQTLAYFKKDIAALADRVEFIYLNEMTMPEMLKTVADVKETAAVMYLFVFRDAAGNSFIPANEVKTFSASAKVPVYTAYSIFMGRGTIGGFLMSTEVLGAKAAEFGLDRLEKQGGPTVQTLVQNSEYQFDWRELKRWGIEENKLPAGSKVLFKELTVWEQYRGYIISGILLIFFQSMLAIGLIINRSRRLKAEKDLIQLNADLENKVYERTMALSNRMQELSEARDQAQTANRAKSTFLANMSHELRTPLNAILGFSNMLRRDAAVQDEQRKTLEIIHRSGEHLLNLINEVLDMAKVEAGRVELQQSAFDLGTMVLDVCDLIRERAEAKGLKLELDQTSAFPRYIQGDPAKLRQIMINLIGNAVKYTDAGSVTLRLDSAPSVDGKTIRLGIVVADTGPGISPKDQERIFEPFVQVGDGSGPKGTGLGLAIVRQYVELMNGNVSLRSTVGEGSEFRVELPVMAATEDDILGMAPDTGQVVALMPGQGNWRILIAEDQEENILLLQRLLDVVGFQTQVARNGQEAVERFAAWRPHFIWMDCRMPVMDGMEATRRIRRMEGGSAVKIVALTASVFREERDAVIACGMDDFLRKPYRPDEIYGVMAKYLAVRYEYAEGAPQGEPPMELQRIKEIVGNLPLELRQNLRNALLTLRKEEIEVALSRIAETHPAAAEALGRQAEHMEFTLMLQELEPDKNGGPHEFK